MLQNSLLKFSVRVLWAKVSISALELFIIFYLLLLNSSSEINAFKLDRVILSTDNNPNYIQFWPIVARTWQELTGLRPTLILVADDSVNVDETLGDVIRFRPIPDIPTSLQAQVLRLFLPVLFPDDGCLISDIDMLPLQKNFFLATAAPYPDHNFVVYRANAYPEAKYHRYPMCYLAAKGRVFSEIFGVTVENFASDTRRLIKAWYKQYWKLFYGSMDEKLLYRRLKRWHNKTGGRVLLDIPGMRVNRGHWQYDAQALQQLQYVDAHMPRPYQYYKMEIDRLISDLGLARILTN